MSKHYAEFRVGDLFEVVTGSIVKDLKKGDTPRINPTEQNNGIGSWTEGDNDLARYFEDFVSVSFLGNVFYQKQRSSLEMKVHGLKRKDERFGDRKGQYIASSVSKAVTGIYDYGMQLSSEKLKDLLITLPITDDTIDSDSPEPDWEYMESYIKEIEEKYLDSVEQYNRRNEDILDALHPDYHGEAPEAYDYAEFLLTDIFEIKNGVRLKSDDHIPGETPFISSREGNNGISDWVMNENDSLDSNVLGVNYNGNVLEAYYHDYDALFSDDVKRFKIKNTEPNRKKYMYLATAIKKLKESYSYTKKFNSTEISKASITLPITSDGKPDWVFMEEYINFIEGGGRREIENYVQHKRKTS